MKITEEYQRYNLSQLMGDLASSAHREEYRGQTSSATYSEIKSRLQAMHLSSGSRILDAGCGNGAFSIPIANEFPIFVDGIDIGAELTKKATNLACEANLSSKCQFYAGDFSDVSVYLANIFDAIICIGSLYWGHALSKILKTWQSVTRPGSQLLLFLNMEYIPLTINEKEAIGGTQFLSALTVQHGLTRHRWALCEWSDATNS
ncbi:MAG: class I SAM-dependent methyltransferase [Parachlamydiaceae bacterium]|nr:class I SAM-dependent methyltransferase [Parachlamydiaceae bacterium]